MIKLTSLLKELLLNEYNKSQLEYIASKLGIERNEEFNSLMNALDAQGVKYPDLKNKIISGEIKSFGDLKALKTQSKSDIAKATKSDSEVVYEDDEIFVVVPYTHDASCYYGKGTRWCTAGREIDHWRNYVIDDEDTLYYIFIKKLSKSNPLYKVAVVVDISDNIIDIYDALDDSLTEREFFTSSKKIISYDIRDKVDFKSKSEKILPIANKEVSKQTDLTVQKYIENGSKGNLKLEVKPISSLPSNLNVEKNLVLSDNGLKSLPSGLKVGLDLLIDNNLSLTSIPADIEIGRNLELSSTGVTSLPDNLTINGSLSIFDTPITKLPRGLKVGKNFNITGMNYDINDIPKDIIVKGSFIIFDTKLSYNYSEDELKVLLKKHAPGINKIQMLP